jgi:flagellar basal body-associated protein FliL
VAAEADPHSASKSVTLLIIMMTILLLLMMVASAAVARTSAYPGRSNGTLST